MLPRRVCCTVVVGLAAVFAFAVPVVRAAESGLDPKEAAAQAELQKLMTPDNPPRTQEAVRALLKELAPKLEAFAEKNAQLQTGGTALMILARVSMFLDDAAKADATYRKFIDRYPKHPQVPDAKFAIATMKAYSGDTDGAKPILVEHLKQFPTYQQRDRVEALLKKISVIGTQAPDFTTKDFAGTPVKLSQFRGKVLFLDFFASWCEPCREEMPNVLKVYEQYHKAGFEVLGIDVDMSIDDAKAYVKQAGIPWTVTFEPPGPPEDPPRKWDNAVAKLYEVDAIPTTYLIDRDGKVVAMWLRGEALGKKVAELLAAGGAPKAP